jgi:hypothetical protein
VPRPADYKTPPRGTSFSPITPPAQGATEPNINNTTALPTHQPLQRPSPQNFQSYLSTADFPFSDDYNDAHEIFDFATLTDVQKEISPPPATQLAARSGPAKEAEKARAAEHEYMDSVRNFIANVKGLLILMRPLDGVRPGEG